MWELNSVHCLVIQYSCYSWADEFRLGLCKSSYVICIYFSKCTYKASSHVAYLTLKLEQRKCWFSSDNSHWGLSNTCLHQSYEELDNFAWLCRLHYTYVWTSCFSFLWSRYCTLWWFYKWPLTFLPVFAHKVCFTLYFSCQVKGIYRYIVHNACVLVSSN